MKSNATTISSVTILEILPIMTGEQAQAIGMEYAKINFPGHQALICTHTDGSNNSGNTKNKRNPIDTNHPYKKISLDLFIQTKADF